MTRALAHILILAVALAGCVSTDYGGEIHRDWARFQQEPSVKGWHPLQGDCRSACTMRLALPKACVHPLASISFHQATNDDGSRSESGTQYVFAKYAKFPRLQARLIQDDAMGSSRLTTYLGRTLISLGVPQCPFDVRATSDGFD